jgi:hypothetical protein
MPDGNAIIAGLVTTITALAGFASFIIKKYMEDMKQIYEARLKEQARIYEAQIDTMGKQHDRLAQAQELDANTARDSLNQLSTVISRVEVLVQERNRGGR